VSPVRPKEYLFDHLVVMGRDSLNELSELFQDKGFNLTPLAHHNLGSSNRLIMLDSTYIELLGWEKGKQIQRAEIANQAIGLDALVFRTSDAQACYEQLKASGFAVNPVQDLSREGEFMDNTVLVEFKTVRFSEQPIPGLRIYFCEHLTPKYVWQEQWLTHANAVDTLKQINIATPNAIKTADSLMRLLNLGPDNRSESEDSTQITLPNIVLRLQTQHDCKGAYIVSASLQQDQADPVDFIIDQHFLTHI
jgi:hypothetical protein